MYDTFPTRQISPWRVIRRVHSSRKYDFTKVQYLYRVDYSVGTLFVYGQVWDGNSFVDKAIVSIEEPLDSDFDADSIGKIRFVPFQIFIELYSVVLLYSFRHYW